MSCKAIQEPKKERPLENKVALYINLKRVDFLKYLPNELVSFMQDKTSSYLTMVRN